MRTVFVVTMAAGVWLAGCGETPKPASSAMPASGRAVAVSVVTASSETWPSLYEATGTVRAQTSATISARISGYVREVKVQAGDHVREGQQLITLDSRDLDVSSKRAEAARDEIRAAVPEADSSIAAAKANLDLAQVTFNRMQELFRKTSISNQEFDEASARLKAAQAALEMARAHRAQLDSRLATAEQEIRSAEVARSYAEVAAPFAGVVIARSVEPGNLATPGAPLLTIEREGAYRLEASVEESYLPSIRMGQAVSIRLDGVDPTFDARVSEIVPAVDEASRAYIVRINLPAMPSVSSGLFGRARFQLGNRTVLAIPASAVVDRGQLQSVFVVDNGAARTRLITTGERAKERIEILSGLTAGDRVILPVPTGLADGTPVELRP